MPSRDDAALGEGPGPVRADLRQTFALAETGPGAAAQLQLQLRESRSPNTRSSLELGGSTFGVNPQSVHSLSATDTIALRSVDDKVNHDIGNNDSGYCEDGGYAPKDPKGGSAHRADITLEQRERPRKNNTLRTL